MIKNLNVSMIRVAFLSAGLAGLLPVWSVSQECPDFTRNTAPLGDSQKIPAGWFAYCKLNENGLYISPTGSFQETLVPNTENDKVRQIDVSDDGKWLMYLHHESGDSVRTYIIRTDGTGKLELPTMRKNHRDVDFPARVAGFVRNSPKGDEIYWSTPRYWINAMQLQLPETGTPSILESRVLLDLSPVSGGIAAWNGSYAINRDKIFGTMVLPLPAASDTFINFPNYAQIPQGGLGTAGPADVYTYRDLQRCTLEENGNYWGCGFTCSWDGEYWLANSGYVGTTCVPNKKSTGVDGKGLDHKGFYLTRFPEENGETLSVDEVPTDPGIGVSINWAPGRFHHGEYNEVDFNHWRFSNSSSYVVGSLLGSAAGSKKGIWVVHWPSNTWTLITPENPADDRDYPVLFFTGSVSTHVPRHGANRVEQKRGHQKARVMVTGPGMRIEPDIGTANLFSVDGRHIGTYRSSAAGVDGTITRQVGSRHCVILVEPLTEYNK
jgi:hypothetical protein